MKSTVMMLMALVLSVMANTVADAIAEAEP
jgi:hypothetical protein